MENLSLETVASNFPTTDFIGFGCALAVLGAFVGLPWFVIEGETFTGAVLVTTATPPLSLDFRLLSLIPVAGIIGVLTGFWALLDPFGRGPASRLMVVGSVIGLSYFVIFAFDPLLATNETTIAWGAGFWTALPALIFMVVQVFRVRTFAEPLTIFDAQQSVGLRFVLPAVYWLVAFTLLPLVITLILSFTDLQHTGEPATWVGFDNYSRFFTDARAGVALATSVFLTLYSVALTLVLGVGIAWLFDRDLPGLGALRAVVTLPLFAAPVALGYLGVIFFDQTNGIFNTILMQTTGTIVAWATEPLGARLSVLIVDVWRWTPLVFLVVLNAMRVIPTELIEAARLETKSEWTRFRLLTLPLISPALLTVALLRFVETLRIFAVPFALTGGGPNGTSQTLAYYAYASGVRGGDLGYGSALSWLLLLLAVVVLAFFFLFLRGRFRPTT
ncbi:MAG: sugar ABC transporter permease [Chloroflexi bacterium]|nr:sugar ABC transporter permease [Chloroflexota bacterium]